MDKAELKFNKLNTALAYFILRVKKLKLRKKDKGKDIKYFCNSGSVITILKYLFIYFTIVEIRFILQDFEKIGFFTTVFKGSW